MIKETKLGNLGFDVHCDVCNSHGAHNVNHRQAMLDAKIKGFHFWMEETDMGPKLFVLCETCFRTDAGKPPFIL